MGQPLFTDDAWWHLALGRAYAEHGPWLDEDPLLFTAPGPPAPAAWLADLALHGLHATAGFAGLRIVHVAAAVAILALAWSLLRRASGSPAIASLATSAFAVLSAYRLVQLRPHLATMLAALLLYRLVLEEGRPSRTRVALAVALLAVWANAHAGFVLGPLLLTAGLAGLVAGALLRSADEGRRDRSRAVAIATVLVLGGAATLLNPGGIDPHLAYFAAGTETPDLARVADEWARVDPFRWPTPVLPPSPLSWALVWALLVATPVATWTAARGRGERVDPVLVAVAVASAALLFSAVRFLWLAIFPLLLLCRGLRALDGTGRRLRGAAWATAACAVLLVPAFARLGALPMVTRALPATWAGYAAPYPAAKWFAHAVWFVDDAGLEGNLFNDYFMGGFAGYWLAPEVRTFANGTLNMGPDAAAANLPLRERRGAREGEDFLASLDRLGIDLFLGIRLPETGNPGRPWFYTTGHLENSPGWIPVFRNLRSAVYLRANERNAANLRRVAEHYEREGVPFDPAAGFDPIEVVKQARPWAVARGLVPFGFQGVLAASHAPDAARRAPAAERLASLFAALGVYDRAVRTDRRSLRADGSAAAPRRRLVWSLLRQGELDEARDEAVLLEGAAREDPLAATVARAARSAAPGDRFDRLPVFTRGEASWLLQGYVPPDARTESSRR